MEEIFMKRLMSIASLLLIIAGLVACTPTVDNTSVAPPVSSPSVATLIPPSGLKTVVVFAAASLTESFTALGDIFEQQNPGVKVEFSFAGTQTLTEQILQGAPADVFASANESYMNKLKDQGKVDQSKIKVFAQNKLVVILPKSNPAGIKTLHDLTKPGIRLVTGTKEVPFGQYTEVFLEKASVSSEFGTGFKDAVHANVVSQETDVKAAVNKVVLGEADASICYLTDAQAVSEQVITIPIPDELNPTAIYPIAPLKEAPNPQWAEQFVNFVLAPEGQQILAKYGFLPPKAEQSNTASPAAIEITDALGRQVRLAQPPKRIVITGKALFMLLDAAYVFP